MKKLIIDHKSIKEKYWQNNNFNTKKLFNIFKLI